MVFMGFILLETYFLIVGIAPGGKANTVGQGRGPRQCVTQISFHSEFRFR